MEKPKKIIIIMFITIAILGIGIKYSIHWSFYDIQRFKGQEYITEATSPDGTYTVTAYLNNGGATTNYAVLGTLKNNINNKTKNIYWQYPCQRADIKWLNNETISINKIELQVKNETYDYRKE